MHIEDGILSGPVLAAGAVIAAAGVARGLWRLDYERIPRVAALSAAFFVAALVHPPGLSIHLILSGLTGLVLGWAAFPAILVALLLQAVYFRFGGITTLGVNVMNMALPAVACYYLFHGAARGGPKWAAALAGFSAGTVGILLSAALYTACMATAGRQFMPVIALTLIGHIPVLLMEGLVTMSAVSFLRKVRPEVLGG